MAWSILNRSTPHVESIRTTDDGLVIELAWGFQNANEVAIASGKVADYVRRLGFVKDVDVRNELIHITLTTHTVWAGMIGWQTQWAKAPEMPGKRTIATMRRTINNKMPGIAFWAEKKAASVAKSKQDQPGRVARGLGQAALQAASA